MQGLLGRNGFRAGRRILLERERDVLVARPERERPPAERRRYRAIWLSDTHLGTRGCKAGLLLDFLEHHDCDQLYLVGDIIDGWSLRRSWFWNEEHNRIVGEILEKGARGTRVVYVCGNHDEFLRRYLGLMFGGVQVVNEEVHVTADQKRLLVLHGDRFDVAIRHARWLSRLGSRAYELTLVVNTWFNAFRRRLGYGYWSLSAYLKHRVKNAVSFMANFEDAVLDEARRRGFDGVVCGHIHHAALREVDGTLYCNDGDWVESCTALVEHETGELEVVRWADASRPAAAATPPGTVRAAASVGA
jgi:UDP-2,3-diacylglucosamine pyrophosphatase LpxH